MLRSLYRRTPGARRRGDWRRKRGRRFLDSFTAKLEEAFQAAADLRAQQSRLAWKGHWAGLRGRWAARRRRSACNDTAVPRDPARGEATPLSPRSGGLQRPSEDPAAAEAKRQAIGTGEGIDCGDRRGPWPSGTLLLEEAPRSALSGRGCAAPVPSASRHAYLIDQKTQAEYVLNNIREGSREVRGLQLPAGGVRRSRLRLRKLQPVADPQHAGAVGGASSAISPMARR